MELAERIFEHMFPSHVNRQVVTSDSFVEPLQLLSEESAFDVEVEYTRVVHENCKRAVS